MNVVGMLEPSEHCGALAWTAQQCGAYNECCGYARAIGTLRSTCLGQRNTAEHTMNVAGMLGPSEHCGALAWDSATMRSTQ